MGNIWRFRPIPNRIPARVSDSLGERTTGSGDERHQHGHGYGQQFRPGSTNGTGVPLPLVFERFCRSYVTLAATKRKRKYSEVFSREERH